MAKALTSVYKPSGTASLDRPTVNTHIPVVSVPEAYIVIKCPCGEEHRISLNDLPNSTSRRIQLEQKCEYARHFIVHSGNNTYRKILIVSEFGDQ